MTAKTQNRLIGAAVVIGIIMGIVYLKKQNDKKKLVTATASIPASA